MSNLFSKIIAWVIAGILSLLAIGLALLILGWVILGVMSVWSMIV